MNDTFYFPLGTFGQKSDADGSDAFTRAWYSRALRAMAEPSLSDGKSGTETYRFLWLRTWARPIAIRLQQDAAALLLHTVELDGAGGYDLGKVSRHDSVLLGSDDSSAVVRALQAADIWNLPTNDGRLGLDGAQWIVEARRGDSYHAVDRWSPEPGVYRTFCELLIEKAHVQLAPRGRNGLY